MENTQMLIMEFLGGGLNAPQRAEYMKCRRLKALTFRINNKGRLSGITAKNSTYSPIFYILC